MRKHTILNIRSQEYVFGTFDRFDLLELIPMAYMFYEISHSSSKFELIDAFETNRKDVIKYAKKITLINFGLHLIFTYPIQMGRVKHLTKNKKIFKTLYSFHNMSGAERQRIIDKKEKFFSS